MKYPLLLLVVLAILESHARVRYDVIPTDSTLPISHIDELDSLESFNGVTYKPGQASIVIYTFRGCKPCAVLAKELNKKIKQGQIAANEVVYVNSHVMDRDKLEDHLNSNDYISPYNVTKKYSDTLVSSYPRAEAFDSAGKKLWSQDGYSPLLIRRIKKHLK
ncbi:hypothetical protein N8368_00045 [Bacteroidia bacterium]|nr:hypothetical protein [Bacteroidia bacterium]MDB9881927.1 hypothetical protein [Bacteroidia bacterium]MDC1394882.1 hypothetical protein [Bacteroidia bacterium]